MILKPYTSVDGGELLLISAIYYSFSEYYFSVC